MGRRDGEMDKNVKGLNSKQSVDRLGVSQSTVHVLVQSGVLRSCKCGPEKGDLDAGERG
jgi:hypothetical protein